MKQRPVIPQPQGFGEKPDNSDLWWVAGFMASYILVVVAIGGVVRCFA